MNASHATLYVTCADRAEARNIAHTLLSEKLIACANLVENVTSLYRWMGELQEDHETVLFMKTAGTHVDKAVTRIQELHSYDTPCIVVWPIIAGEERYLEWIDRQLVVPE